MDKDTGELNETGDWAGSATAVEVYEHEKEEETTRYAAVVDGDWLTIINVTDPGAPDPMGDLTTGDSRDVRVKYPHAIVANGDSADGILMIDISDPGSLTEDSIVDTYDTTGSVEAIAMYESYIHAAVGKSGILVLGITDSDSGGKKLIEIDLDSDEETNPYYNTPGYASDVFIAEKGLNRFTYVADNHGGFLKLKNEDRFGEGINEQPFEDSPDDSSRIECFISSLF